MHTLIIYCHPYEKSFNHAVLEQVEQNLTQHQVTFKTIDLYAENFNPVYSKAELALYSRGGTLDPQVTAYLKLLRMAKTVIFITPYWWGSIPGMLKGFIDKVMKEGPGLSHTVGKFGLKGELTNVQHCYVLTTSTSPTFYIRLLAGNAIKAVFIRQNLKQVGFKRLKWQNFGGITGSSLARRKRYLARVEQQAFK